MEVTYEMLVDELKEELCRVTHNSQDECCLEVEDAKKQIEEEFDMEDKANFMKDVRSLFK